MQFPKFINKDIEHEFNQNGYVHIANFLNKDELAELVYLFKENYNFKGESSGMWNSLFNLDENAGLEVSNGIIQILKVKLLSAFTDFVNPVASFMVKNPNLNGITDLHRDYSTQDEERFQYRNIWIPLVDVTKENGALYALPGSHNFFNYPLPMFCKWPYVNYHTSLIEYCKTFEVKAGDLIVYADRTIHGSFINQTDNARPVVHFGLLHPNSKLCYYYLNPITNVVTVYEVPFRFFFENNFGNQDHRFNIIKKFNYTPPDYTWDEIYERYISKL